MSYNNFDEIIDRQGTYSSKYDECWNYNPYLPKENYIPMWIADMDFACPQPMLDAIKQQNQRIRYYVISYDLDIKAAFGHSKYCGAPNPVSIAGIVAAYNECEEWLEEMLEYLDGNFEYLDSFIKNNLPKVKFRISESTFLAWLDLSAYGKRKKRCTGKLPAQAYI